MTHKIKPEDIVFLSGAGISVESPTNGPKGIELAVRALNSYFLSETKTRIKDVYEVFEINREVPRLEVILEILFNVYGTIGLDDVLSDMKNPKPNRQHLFFRKHLEAGGGHITANFDNAIEGNRVYDHLIHFHGSIKESSDKLGARLSQLESGFNNNMQRQLEKVLVGNKYLVVVGYSGSDYFDMSPYLLDFFTSERSKGMRLIWVNHKETEFEEDQVLKCFSDSILLGKKNSIRILDHLQEKDANISYVEYKTSDFLNYLSQHWWGTLLDPVSNGSSKWKGNYDASEFDRALCTYRLYCHMGMYRDCEILSNKYSFLKQYDCLANAELSWQRGKYKVAMHYWAKSYSDINPNSNAQKLEREAAVAWIRGSYLKAYNKARKSIAYALESKNESLIALCYEMLGRILIRMSESPEFKIFGIKKKLLSFVADTREIQPSLLDLHSKTRFEDCRNRILKICNENRILKEDACSKSTSANADREFKNPYTLSFDEYESLSAVVDYQRGNFRKNEGKPISYEDKETYIKRAEVLGKENDLYTFMLIPETRGLFSKKEIIKSLLNMDATLWHKMRLLVSLLCVKKR